MSRVVGRQCRECGREGARGGVGAWAGGGGGREPVYGLDEVRRSFTRETIASRPRDLWRYRELLPLDGEPTVGHGTGFTPLLPAPRLRQRLGIADLWVKYDAARHPTLSFKDRLGAGALPQGREVGMGTGGCASTGNLAHPGAAGAGGAGPAP